MSTKTTLKRIALVAVSALGFGLMATVAPASAALTVSQPVFLPTTPSTGWVANATNSVYTGTQQASTGGFVTLTANSSVSGANSLTLTVTGSTIALSGSARLAYYYDPTGSQLTSTGFLSGSSISGGVITDGSELIATDIKAATRDALAASFGCDSTTAGGDAGTYPAVVTGLTTVNAYTFAAGANCGTLYIADANDTDASTLGLARNAFFRIATATAGGITAQLTAQEISGGVAISTLLQTFNVAVTAGTIYNGTVTVTRDADNDGWLGGNNAIYAPASTPSQIGDINVDTGLTNPALAPAWTFSLSGVGKFSIDNGVTTTAYAAVPAQTAVEADVLFYADGRTGTSTLTVSVNGNVVATQVLNFYGVATEIKVIPFYQIARAGTGSAGFATGTILDGAAPAYCAPADVADWVGDPDNGILPNDPAVAVQVVDENGMPMPVWDSNDGGALFMTSSNTAVISSDPDGTVNGDGSFLDCGVAGKTAGILLNHYIYRTNPAAKSGQSATLTWSTVNALGKTISSTPLTISVGGSTSGGTVTVTLDKATYQPGERMVLTVTGKDSSGNKVRDNLAVGTLSSNKAVQGLATGVYVDGAYILGDDSGEDLFAPAVSGAFDIILYTGTATGASVKVTATVGDDAATAAASAAADAALEAIDAANAATDAANLAAEAADAATVAAEEARDAADAATAAVEALATEIASLIASLRAQIQTLANTVAKIAKKVKA